MVSGSDHQVHRGAEGTIRCILEIMSSSYLGTGHQRLLSFRE